MSWSVCCDDPFIVNLLQLLTRDYTQEASVLFVELSHFHELALASKPEAVMKLLNDVFWDVSWRSFIVACIYTVARDTPFRAFSLN